jgi:hypothetical protein
MQGYNANAITLLADDAQTLQDESLTQIDGRTTLTFTKLLVEDGEPAMSINGTNLVFAFGSGNTFSYHAPGRGGIALSFGRDGPLPAPGPQPEEPGPQPEEPGPQPEEPVPQPEEPVPQPEEPVLQPEEPVPQPEEPVPLPEEPVPQPEEPVPQPAPAEGSAVQVAVTLTISLDSIPEGSDARTDFEADIVSELAAALDIPQSRVRLLSVRAGSVVITFEILPSDSASDPTAAALAQTLESLVDDTDSAIYTSSSVLADIDAESLVLQADDPVPQPEVPSAGDAPNATGIPDKASGATTASTTVALFACVAVVLLHAQCRRI